MSSPASAARADVPLNTYAWWWTDAESEETDVLGNKVLVEGTNPYCPATGGSAGAGGSAASQEACQEGRLPIWVRNGDFENPTMSFALDIDTSLLAGASIESFTVKLLEADCDPADGRKDTPQCEQLTTTIPQDNPASQSQDEFESSFRVQVCTVTEIFGEGEARPVDERPRFRCDLEVFGDRRLLRSPVNPATGAPTHLDDHVWVFDLTEVAKTWVEEFTIPTAVLFRAEPPRNPRTSDQYRVVFAGTKDKAAKSAENVQQQPGVEIEAIYSGGGGFGDIPGGGDTVAGTSFGAGTGSASDFGTGTTDTGTSDFGTGTTDTGATPDPVETPEPSGPAADLQPQAGGGSEPMPGYVWLGILAGLAGFALVRTVVIPATTGIRPDGVLAQIQAINAQRRGTTLAEMAGTGPTFFGRVATGVATVGRGIAGVTGRISFFKR
ncbi:MAG: hypothetical protein GEU78_01570 [Actinobacteria bacterium]|nr:hypothetical protein [Actinomycetota bacterium]